MNKELLKEIGLLVIWTISFLSLTYLMIKGNVVGTEFLALVIIYVIVLFIFFNITSDFIKAWKIITYPERCYIRKYENTNLVEYIKIKYVLDTTKKYFILRGFSVKGWQQVTISNIIDYEHELQCEWLESITEEQYNELKMLEELKK